MSNLDPSFGKFLSNLPENMTEDENDDIRKTERIKQIKKRMRKNKSSNSWFHSLEFYAIRPKHSDITISFAPQEVGD